MYFNILFILQKKKKQTITFYEVINDRHLKENIMFGT